MVILCGCISIPIGPSEAKQNEKRVAQMKSEAVYSLEYMRRNPLAYGGHIGSLQKNLTGAGLTLKDVGSSSEEIAKFRADYEAIRAKAWGKEAKLRLQYSYLDLEKEDVFSYAGDLKLKLVSL